MSSTTAYKPHSFNKSQPLFSFFFLLIAARSWLDRDIESSIYRERSYFSLLHSIEESPSPIFYFQNERKYYRRAPEGFTMFLLNLSRLTSYMMFFVNIQKVRNRRSLLDRLIVSQIAFFFILVFAPRLVSLNYLVLQIDHNYLHD